MRAFLRTPTHRVSNSRAQAGFRSCEAARCRSAFLTWFSTASKSAAEAAEFSLLKRDIEIRVLELEPLSLFEIDALPGPLS